MILQSACVVELLPLQQCTVWAWCHNGTCKRGRQAGRHLRKKAGCKGEMVITSEGVAVGAAASTDEDDLGACGAHLGRGDDCHCCVVSAAFWGESTISLADT